jgi:hypothetical protein
MEAKGKEVVKDSRSSADVGSKTANGVVSSNIGKNKAPDAVNTRNYNKGRSGKQKRLKELAVDPKVSSADRGWLQQDLNSIKRGKRTTLRVPPTKELAHKRGFEAAKGFGYEHSHLQDKSNHKLQHKYDGMGKKNKAANIKEEKGN